jgi:hypothetical protein
MKAAPFTIAILAFAALGIGMPVAHAASPEVMMAQCRDRAHAKLHTSAKNIETKYEGQRTDGTHAVNGTAYIDNQTRTFQCSFNKRGDKIVRFVVNKDAGSGSAGTGATSGGGMPSRDQQACLAAVSNSTNNGDVTILRTETSEANNMVVVGVGAQRAPWRCLVKDGVVAEVMSMTNEGSL